jgi:serine phosphatase RsbU (regulator of sigma subunit)
MNQQSIVAQDLRSAMAVPLMHHDDTLGALYVDTNDPLTGYGESDLQVLTLLGQMLGAKIANARLLEVARERDRLEEELRTAATIQQRLLPQTLPDVCGYEIFASQETCEAVGGDLYDADVLPNGRLQVVLGDVSGKGIPAALLMSDVLAMVRALRPFALPVADLVERLHRHVLGRTEAERYLTLFVAEIDPVSHRIEYVNAGHPPPRLVHADGSAEKLDTTGIWVGLVDLPGVEYTSSTLDFPAGSTLVVTSDGIDEAGRGDEEFYGDARYDAMLPEWAGGSAEEIGARLLEDVASFRGSTPAGDDVTLVVVHRLAE